MENASNARIVVRSSKIMLRVIIKITITATGIIMMKMIVLLMTTTMVVIKFYYYCYY